MYGDDLSPDIVEKVEQLRRRYVSMASPTSPTRPVTTPEGRLSNGREPHVYRRNLRLHLSVLSFLRRFSFYLHLEYEGSSVALGAAGSSKFADRRCQLGRPRIALARSRNL